MCRTSIFRKVPLFPSLILMPFHHQEEKAKISAIQSEDIQYYVLLNIIAGPEAVLRQPLEDMKVFECPEVLEFNQVREYS